MSRSVTPMSGAVGSATAPTGSALDTDHSKPTSLMGHDTAATDHAQGTSEHPATGETNQDERGALLRSNSQMSQSATYIPSRGGTLKKKASLHKSGSVKRSGSRRSSYAGSVRSMKLGEKDKHEPAEYNSAFYCPIPTTGTPTELLANRFQAWRKVLKDLINYFRDLHKSFDTRSKSLVSASNVINNSVMPYDFLKSGGISDAADLMRNFHKQALTEAAKARDLENEVVLQLTGLRSDLSQKIKEIKGLSGDFKNSISKDQDSTRKAVSHFQEALGHIDHDGDAAAGKGDPFLIKLGVERQLERQIEEENYLHRAFLNLEASGRELESIVVGEIQKAYNVLAGILKRDADNSYDTAEKLREGPLAMTHDHEWDAFVTGNPNMVDPRQPLRQVQNITYDGKDHPAAIEVKSGMLERKSKYLKNYTPGWYILSPTHLHEFKSADQIPFQAPVMSLYLPDQKLGTHSEPGSSSHKFMLKGRQTGSMHRGHTWIFRAETHDTMMAWFSDIRELTEKRGEARNEFVRRTHARSLSAGSQRAASIGSAESQMDEDEADRTAFSGEQSVRGLNLDQVSDAPVYAAGGMTGSGLTGDDARSDAGWRPQRPQPGGRFPSEVNVTRGLQAPLSPSSGDSGDEHDREIVAAATALPGSALPAMAATHDQKPSSSKQPAVNEQPGNFSSSMNTGTGYTTGEHPRVTANPTGAADVAPDTQSQYHEWVGTAGAAMAGTGAGALGATAVQRHRENTSSPESAKDEMSAVNPAIPSEGHSSAPIASTYVEPSQTQTQTGARELPVTSSENYSSAPIVDLHNESTQAGLHGSNEPSGITASIYQQTTMPSKSVVDNKSGSSSTAQSALNGNLISGTDIRAPAGSAYIPVSTKAEPTSDVPSTTSVSQSMGSGLMYSSTMADSTRDVPDNISRTVSRPSPIHTKSVQTISDLHIPGEFPKSASSTPR